jgi:serine/threonine-protein kinase RsbW
VTPAATGRPDVEVEIPPRPEYVGVVRHLMGAVARLGQHSPEFVENAKLAGSEACTNAVMLTGRAGSQDRIEVRALLDGEELRIEVADRGASATEAASAPGADLEPSATPVHGFEGGLSLPLLEGLVDELAIDERDGGGNVVRMRLIRDIEEDAG